MLISRYDGFAGASPPVLDMPWIYSCSRVGITMNRHYKVITSLENAARIERTIFEYRKLVLGLIGRIIISWGGGEEFFAAAIERLEKSIEDSDRDLEIIEKLFCFPTSFADSSAPDFERFAYKCPQYYLRQAIVAALGAVQARAKHFVRPLAQSDERSVAVLDLLMSERPWLSLYGNERGVCFNMNDLDRLPCRNYWSDRDEVLQKPRLGRIYKLKMFDGASATWKWCDFYANHGLNDEQVAEVLASCDIPDAILLPEEMIVWSEHHMMQELRIFSAKTPNTKLEPELAAFDGLQIPECFISYALKPSKVA